MIGEWESDLDSSYHFGITPVSINRENNEMDFTRMPGKRLEQHVQTTKISLLITKGLNRTSCNKIKKHLRRNFKGLKYGNSQITLRHSSVNLKSWFDVWSNNKSQLIHEQTKLKGICASNKSSKWKDVQSYCVQIRLVT